MMQVCASIARTKVLGQRIDLDATAIKWGVIASLNVVAFALSSLVSPPPAPQERALWEITQFFPGGLSVIGETLATVLGTVLNWRALGYLVIANAAAFVPLLFGAKFIRQLYQFDALASALGYLMDAFLISSNYSHETQPRQEAASPDRGSGLGGARVALFRNGRLVPAGMRSKNRSIARAGGPGVVIVPPEYTVQLERDGRLSRVLGPGVVHLARFERVYKPVRLRQIIRRKTATAHTRDGIPVTVEITVQARIRASAVPTKKNPYPFDRDAVTRLVVSTTAGKSGPLPWEDRPARLVASVLNDVLSRYCLDELLDPLDQNLRTPRPTIQREVLHALRQRVHEFGLDITAVWLGEFQLPVDVIEQYLAYWQADWQRQDQIRPADSQASHIRQMSRARAEAQQLVVETLVAAFQSVQDSGLGIDQRQLAAVRLIDSLEQLHDQIEHAEGEPDMRLIALERHLERLRETLQTQTRSEIAAPGPAK